MKVSWGIGSLVAILISLAAAFLVPLTFEISLSLIFLLVGLWTVVAGFSIVAEKDRAYYVGWGGVVALLSLFAYLPPYQVAGLILVAVVLIIIILVVQGRSASIVATTGGSPPASSGGAPAAS